MKPTTFEISYETNEGPRRISAGVGAPFETQDLVVSPCVDGSRITCAIETKTALTVTGFSLELAHEFGARSRILVNGYQSWTDTVELSVKSRMHGVNDIPKPVLRKWVLDGSGDYRFAGYDGKPGHLHGYTYAYMRADDACELVGSLDESDGFTKLEVLADEGKVVVRPEVPFDRLEAHETHMLVQLALVRGSIDECFDAWFSLSGITARTTRPIVGYTSWYRHYYDIDEAKLTADLEAARDAFAQVETGDALKVFQIDDGYCTIGDWLDVNPEKFPQGLAPLGGSARHAGFTPGLWIAPFVCEKDSRLFKEHPDWLLRDDDGNLVKTGCHWSGGYALDTRTGAFRSYLAEVLQTITRGWGFRLLKIDFLYAACMLPHDGCNRGQLMHDALELVRSAVPDGVLLLGCGVPLGSAFGIVDYCRIGCDVGLDWDGKLYMRGLDRERVSTKRSLANTIGRAPLDGRAFANDPDVFFLRNDVKLSASQRALLLETDCTHASMLMTSDDMRSWDERARARYQHAVRALLDRTGANTTGKA